MTIRSIRLITPCSRGREIVVIWRVQFMKFPIWKGFPNRDVSNVLYPKKGVPASCTGPLERGEGAWCAEFKLALRQIQCRGAEESRTYVM